MPSKQRIQAAIKRGYNPYSIVGAMLKKGALAKSQREAALYKITAAVLKHKHAQPRKAK